MPRIRTMLAAVVLMALAVPQNVDAKPKRKKPKPKPPVEEPAEPPAEEMPDDDAPAEEPSAEEPDSDGAGAEPETTTDESSAEFDVDALRREYLTLRDELFRSRARAATVASQMYSSRLRIHLDYGSARFYAVTRAVVRLDGASVFDNSEGAIAANKAPRFEGYIAPGRHLVTVRVEAAGKDDQRFTTATESTFVVMAEAGSDTVVTCTAEDDGDIAYSWKRNKSGSYKLDLDIKIKSESRKSNKKASLRDNRKIRSALR